MARLLGDDRHHDDDLCPDMSGSGSSSGSSSHGGHRHHHHHHHGLIPVGNIHIDCSPVSFATRGQVFNLVSCAVTQTLTVPVTQTVTVQTPAPFGCIMCTPTTQTMMVPVETTVNVPPVLVPVPRLVCPPSVTSPATVAATSPTSGGCGCHG